MMGKIKVLYIQHAGALGGSAKSLSCLLEFINRSKYDPVVLCIHNNSELVKLYERRGVETYVNDKIHTFNHTTGGWYSLFSPMGIYEFIKAICGYIPSIKETRRFIRELNPDVVHLNSLVLSPSAWGVKLAGVPLVWHIRESVVKGHLGIRKYLLKKMVNRLADEAVFICENDRNTLLGGKAGTVVYNFVDGNLYDIKVDPSEVRRDLGIAPGDKVILFMGGKSVIKGIFPLLRALPLVKTKVPETQCLMAGAIYEQSKKLLHRAARKVLPLIGSGTVSQKVDKIIETQHMSEYVHLLPWRNDVELLIAACDVLVFPSIEPHFARPVIEAEAMAKPVVASRIGGVEELVEDGVTGILVPPGDPRALADALVKVLQDEGTAKKMGEEGYKMAKERYSPRNVRMIEEIYDRLLTNGSEKDA